MLLIENIDGTREAINREGDCGAVVCLSPENDETELPVIGMLIGIYRLRIDAEARDMAVSNLLTDILQICISPSVDFATDRPGSTFQLFWLPLQK